MLKKMTLLLLLFAACGQTKAGLVGIEVPTGDGRVTVKAPYVVVGVVEGGAADRAGIKPDDVIIRINDSYVKGMAYSDALVLLRGKKGEPVTLVVERGKEQFVFRFPRD